jgi:V/A-type H+-transporting ATPase subunit C
MADDTRYAYAVARVRGMETRLLDRQWIERLLAETAQGTLKALSDSAYADAVADVGRPEDLERGLERALAETLRTVAEISPEPELIDLFRIRWDFRNLKSLLKASVQNLSGADIGVVRDVGTVDAGFLEKAVREKDYTMVPAFLAEPARQAEEAYRSVGELSVIDEVLDAALWTHTLAVARGHGDSFLGDFFAAEIDLANIKTFVRMKDAGKELEDLSRALIPGGTVDLPFFEAMLGEPLDAFARGIEYGRYGSLSSIFRDWSRDKAHLLELGCDNLLLRLTEPGKTIAYGIEPLVAFILLRRIEIKLVRAAVIAKLDGLERSEIEGRLRSAHV